MKICIYGAGAIGGYVGLMLAEGGAEVSLVARGAHLEAIRDKGLTLDSEDGRKTVKLAASDNPADLGPQDYVVIALKAHQAWETAEATTPLLGPDTAVVTMQNGVPWWYFYGLVWLKVLVLGLLVRKALGMPTLARRAVLGLVAVGLVVDAWFGRDWPWWGT